MKLYEVVFSPTGGTRKVADIMAEEFHCQKEVVDITEAALNLEFTADDVCLVAIPSFGGRVPAIAVERISQMTGAGAKAVMICVYGNRAYEDTLLELKDVLVKAGFVPFAAVSAVAEHSIMHQFAAGRPDADDKTELQEFAAQIIKKLETQDNMSMVEVPGNSPYKDYGGVPLKPKAGRACDECGICVKSCPVNAIFENHPKETEEKLCISCMRCIAVCPKQARGLNKLMVAAASKKLKKVCEVRKKNELFIG